MIDRPGPKATRRDERAERLAAALKANLRRRKEAGGGRTKADQETQPIEKTERPRQTQQPHGAEPVPVSNDAAPTTPSHDSAQITSDKGCR